MIREPFGVTANPAGKLRSDEEIGVAVAAEALPEAPRTVTAVTADTVARRLMASAYAKWLRRPRIVPPSVDRVGMTLLRRRRGVQQYLAAPGWLFRRAIGRRSQTGALVDLAPRDDVRLALRIAHLGRRRVAVAYE